MESLNVYGNKQGDTLLGLKMRVNQNQVIYGRYGLLLELKTDTFGRNEKFSITEYPCWKILDGQIRESESGKAAVDWALLDESAMQFNRTSKQWQYHVKRRVVGLDLTERTPRYYQAVLDGDDATGQWGQMDIADPLKTLDPSKVVYPSFRKRTLDFVPLTIVNSTKLGMDEWQDPPLLDLANVAIGHYQQDSYHKYALAKHACPTVIIMNHKRDPEHPQRFRLGGVVTLQSANPTQPVSISLMETSGAGLAEMRETKRDLVASANRQSVQMILDAAGANSSAEALSLRTSVGTASIAAIDKTGGRAIEEQMIFAAIFAGATPDQAGERISFRPDTTYLDSGKTISEVVSMMTANNTGGSPFLSRRNLYAMVQKAAGDGTISTFEENEEQLEEDILNGYAPSASASAPPPNYEEDDDEDQPEEDAPEEDETENTDKEPAEEEPRSEKAGRGRRR